MHRCLPLLPVRVATLLFAATALSGALASARAQSITLTADASTSPVHTVIHFSAAVQSATPCTGFVTFTDAGSPSASVTVPLSRLNTAVLAVASLSAGTHTLTAAYSGDATHASASSNSVAVSVTGTAAPFTVSASATSVYAGSPLTLSALGLPSPATGTVSFTAGGSTLGSAAVPGVLTPAYSAFGDSITWGATLADMNTRYATLVAGNLGMQLVDFGIPGSIACDVLPMQILASSSGPTQANAPLSSLVIGTNDVDFFGPGPSEANFETCHQAALAWLAIPREYKVLAGDPAASITSGAWSVSPALDNTYRTLYNSSGAGSARFNLTSAGGPVYLWYLIGDHLAGSFTLSVDGVPGSTVYTTHPSQPIGSYVNPDSVGFALLRLPLAPGPHTFDILVQSGTVGVLGVATPPSPGGASVHPTVLATPLPTQLITNPYSPVEALAQYTQDALADISALQSDGLDVRVVNIDQTFQATPAEMDDQLHPSVLGHAHIAAAFESVLANVSLTPFATFAGATPSTPVTLTQPGSQAITASYSGDALYTASTAAVTVTVIPQNPTSTSLSASSVTTLLHAPVTFSASVAPYWATGSVTLWDGTQVLAQLPLLHGQASFTSSALAAGAHALTATYSGDTPNASSQSPLLNLQVNLNSTTLTLGSLPSQSIYGALTALTATLSSASATGTLTFRDSFMPPSQASAQSAQATTQILGEASLSNGSASVTIAALAPGTHTITAAYSGDSAYLPAGSAAHATDVSPASSSTTLAPIAASSFGSPVTLSASVFPAGTTGSVTFTDSAGGQLAQVPLVATGNGSAASFTSSTFTPGPHAFTAAYSGDANYTASVSPTVSTSIAIDASTTTLTPIGTTLTIGSPVTLTAVLSPASATGSVLFQATGTGQTGTLGQAAVASGRASLTLTTLPTGNYTLSAVYSGDTDTAPSTSARIATQIILIPTTLALAPVPGSASFATPITLTASLSPAFPGQSAAAASGLITFLDNGTVLAHTLLVNGAASFTPSTLAIGTHSFAAYFPGDSTHGSASAPVLTSTITPDTTATTLALAQLTVTAGSPVIFNVRVNSTDGTIPAGSVTVRSGALTLASAPLANGTAGVAYATLAVDSSTLGLGTFPAVAFYTGDTNDIHSDSSATPVTFNVAANATSAALILSATQITLETPVTLTAALTSSTGQIPTGTISFLNRGAVVATVAADASGQASASIASLPAGAYALSATFTPTGLFGPSTATPQTLLVTLPLALAFTPATVSLAAGASTSAALVLTPLSHFSGPVSAVCVSPVAFLTCTLDAPASVSGTPATGTLHLSAATSTLAAALAPPHTRTRTHPALYAAMLAVLLPLLSRRHRRRIPALLTFALLGALVTAVTGCGQGGNFYELPSGAQYIQVNVTAAGTTLSSTLTVNVSD